MKAAVQPFSIERLLTRAWTSKGLLVWLLWPISMLFGALGTIRRVAYKVGIFKTMSVLARVIVVGNVVAGGSGKTPVVIALVRHMQVRGIKVGVISRGYGRTSNDCLEVSNSSTIANVGDEPALIHLATSAPVVVASSRYKAAMHLMEKHPDTEVIISDDGLQHLGLHRDVEICVFDDRGIGNGLLLPAGPLREHWPRAANLVLHTGKRPAFAGFTSQRTLAPHARKFDGTEVALSDLVIDTAKPLLAVAAIAKPEDFFEMLRAHGLKLERTLTFPDHDDFNSWNVNEYDRYTIICTEKDAVKLWPKHVQALAVPLIFTPEPAFLAELDTLLSRLLPAP
jgi:tetraacyldisaccharide 4'-kinase